jgi:hypothetical protein
MPGLATLAASVSVRPACLNFTFSLAGFTTIAIIINNNLFFWFAFELRKNGFKIDLSGCPSKPQLQASADALKLLWFKPI